MQSSISELKFDVVPGNQQHTMVRSKPPPMSSSRATTSYMTPHSCTLARSSTGLVLKSCAWLMVLVLSSGMAADQPDSPTCHKAIWQGLGMAMFRCRPPACRQPGIVQQVKVSDLCNDVGFACQSAYPPMIMSQQSIFDHIILTVFLMLFVNGFALR